MKENKFKAANERDEVIDKLLKMGLTVYDLRWLAEGILERVDVMLEEEKWIKKS